MALGKMSERWRQDAVERHARQGHPRGGVIVASWRVVPGTRRTPNEVRLLAEREYGPARKAHASEGR